MVANQWRTIVVIILITTLSAVPYGGALAGEGSHLLDGKSFVGKNGEKGRPLDPNEDEEIVFHDGFFTSVSCEPYNFESGEYFARVVGNTIYFEAVTQSPTHGKIAWQGKVNGNEAEMTFVWTKERWYWDIHKEYWFKGALKQ